MDSTNREKDNIMTKQEYEDRVRELEAEGMTRSDAQGIADAEQEGLL